MRATCSADTALCTSHVGEYELWVSDGATQDYSSAGELCASGAAPTLFTELVVACTTVGRYVRLRFVGSGRTQDVSLAEVEVFASDAPTAVAPLDLTALSPLVLCDGGQCTPPRQALLPLTGSSAAACADANTSTSCRVDFAEAPPYYGEISLELGAVRELRAVSVQAPAASLALGYYQIWRGVDANALVMCHDGVADQSGTPLVHACDGPSSLLYLYVSGPGTSADVIDIGLWVTKDALPPSPPPAPPPPSPPPPSPPPPEAELQVTPGGGAGGLSAALQRTRSEEMRSTVVRLRLSSGSYAIGGADGALVFGGDLAASEVRIVGGDGVVIDATPDATAARRLSATAANPAAAISVRGGARVFLEQLTLRGARGAPLLNVSDGGFLALSECVVRDAADTSALVVSGGDVSAENCSFDGNAAAAGGAGGAVAVFGGSFGASACRFTNNRATDGGAIAALGDTAVVSLVASTLSGNVADATGGALLVSAGQVALASGTMLQGNEAPSGASIGRTAPGSLRYELPAPLGRWVLAEGGVATLAQQSYADLPYACAPGVYGDSLEHAAQSGPACAEVCPAGLYCPGASTAPLVCPEGSYCALGSGTPTACPAGLSSNRTGLRRATDCTPCQPGFWCAQGRSEPCGANTYNPSEGGESLAACLACPDASETVVSPATSPQDCLCSRSYYAANSTAEGLPQCRPCPTAAAECTEVGTTLATLPMLRGHWRTSGTSTDIRQCPSRLSIGDNGTVRESGCIGGAGFADDLCDEWLAGPLCTLCNVSEGRYYDAVEYACLPCEFSPTNSAATIAIGGALLLLLGMTGARLRRLLREKKLKRMLHLIHHARRLKRRLTVKAKQLVSFYQIVTRVTTIYQVTMPATVTETVSRFSVVMVMSFDGLGLPLQCWGDQFTTFFSRLLFTAIFPLLLILLVFLVTVARSLLQCAAKRADSSRGDRDGVASTAAKHDEPRATSSPAEEVKASTGHHRRGSYFPTMRKAPKPTTAAAATQLQTQSQLGGRGQAKQQRRSDEIAREGREATEALPALRQGIMAGVPWALRLSYLAFPIVSSQAFSALNCACFDSGASFMVADYSVTCRASQCDADGAFDDEYRSINTLAIVIIVIWAGAVPIGYGVLLWSVRDALHTETPTPLSAALEFLHAEYEPHVYFWELIDSSKKLVLVGFLSLDPLPGTTMQLIIAFVFSICYLMLQMQAAPFRRHEDDFLAMATSFSLVFVFFFCLILREGVLIEKVEDSLTAEMFRQYSINGALLGVGLVTAVLLALVLAFGMMLLHIFAEARDAAHQAALEKQLQQFLDQEAPTDEEAAALESLVETKKMPVALKERRIAMEDLNFPPNARIAHGNFGEVFKATYKQQAVAVKRLSRTRLAEPLLLEAFAEEGALMAKLDHPNVISIIGACWSIEHGSMCLVLELCTIGALQGLLDDETQQLPWATRRVPIARDIARGMNYLHNQSPCIIHRDLKPANVLLAPSWTAKLCDFGTSREHAAGGVATMTAVGTPLYEPPEVMRRDAYDESCDVWSFGCVLFALSTRQQPYHDTDANALADADRGTMITDDLMIKLRAVQNEQLAPALIDTSPFAGLVAMCCAFDPEERPSFGALLGHIDLVKVAVEGQPDHNFPAKPGGALAELSVAGPSPPTRHEKSKGASSTDDGGSLIEATCTGKLHERRDQAKPKTETKQERMDRRRASLGMDAASLAQTGELLRSKTRPLRQSKLLDRVTSGASSSSRGSHASGSDPASASGSGGGSEGGATTGRVGAARKCSFWEHRRCSFREDRAWRGLNKRLSKIVQRLPAPGASSRADGDAESGSEVRV